MHWIYLVASSVFVGSGLALPSSKNVLHEKRHAPLNVRRERVAPDAIIPIRIGLKQSNLHLGYDRLMEVSHPASETYGQHLTAENVHDLFAPAEESVNTVRDWLLSSGIKETDILSYKNKGWLALDIPAKDAERLFSTEYHEHDVEDGSRIGCDEYYLPQHVSNHVDFIKPGVTLSAPLKKRTVEKRALESGGHWRPGRPGPGWPKPPGHIHGNPHPHWQPPHWLPADLQNCAVNITPTCIKALYHIPEAKYHDPANVMGLYESYDAFSQADLDIFYANFAKNVPQGTAPKVISVDGGTAPVAAGSVRNSGESDIDTDLAISLIYPQSVTIYQVDDIPNSSGETNKVGVLNTILDSVDGSYCNYTAYGITGDSPDIDPVYPDTTGLAGAYTGPLECGAYSLTRVLSISYGYPESYYTKQYMERQCNELMKLGLMGHSILEASGDYGVASFPGSNGNPNGCLSGNGQNDTIYNPDALSGCPYMTSVGATRLYENDTVYDQESAMQVNLTAFNIATGEGSPDPTLQFFASSGGFSNVFTPPSYQAKAVARYLSEYTPEVPSYSIGADAPANVTSLIGLNGGVYNRAGRGWPDVSANGAFLLISNNLTIENFFGTSLSAPIFASVLTLINEERTAAGKGPIGFVNPVLYSHPEVLNDIVNGSNPNCGSAGFKAAPGWDPVTGLGTPNYPKMLKLWLSLP